jgi:hypothetical protein
MLLGDIPERVDRAAEELHAGDRDPALAAVGVQRQSRRLDRLACRPDRDALGDLLPAGNRLRRRLAHGGFNRDTGDRRRSGVPEADESAPVEQEDALADMGEHLVCIGTRLDLGMQARLVDRQRDHPRNRPRPGKIIRHVRRGVLTGHERERSDRAAALGGERQAHLRLRELLPALTDDVEDPGVGLGFGLG